MLDRAIERKARPAFALAKVANSCASTRCLLRGARKAERNFSPKGGHGAVVLSAQSQTIYALSLKRISGLFLIAVEFAAQARAMPTTRDTWRRMLRFVLVGALVGAPCRAVWTWFGTYGLPDPVRLAALGPAALIGAVIGGLFGLLAWVRAQRMADRVAGD
jgi:hypothetical protein